jgi:hypothetical protein
MGRPLKVSRVQSCTDRDHKGRESTEPDGILTIDIPGTENFARRALNSSGEMIAWRPIVDVTEPGSPRGTAVGVSGFVRSATVAGVPAPDPSLFPNRASHQTGEKAKEFPMQCRSGGGKILAH